MYCWSLKYWSGQNRSSRTGSSGPAERYRPCRGAPQAAVVVSGSGLQTNEQQVLAEGKKGEESESTSEAVLIQASK